MKSIFDVIVVGSGPAGATTGIMLAKRGLSTLILEKEHLPRYKACGGGLTSKILSFADLDLVNLCEQTITRVGFAYHHKMVLDCGSAEPFGWCVMRDKFDHQLATRAVAAGATLEDQQTVRTIDLADSGVTVTTDAGQYNGKVLVGADGANGVVAKAAGLQPVRSRAVGLELEAEVPADQFRHAQCRFHFDVDPALLPRGVAWIFPKANHLSIGIAMSEDRLALLRAKSSGGSVVSMHELLRRWIEGEPMLRNHRVLVVRGHRLPFRAFRAPLQAQRVLLVGDAAGLIHPVTGEGIYYAMRSGQIAANIIEKAIRSNTWDLSSYTQAIEREFGLKFSGYTEIMNTYHFFAKKWGPKVLSTETHMRQLTERFEFPLRVKIPASGSAGDLTGRAGVDFIARAALLASSLNKAR